MYHNSPPFPPDTMSKSPASSSPPPKHPGPISDKLCRKYLGRPQFAGELIDYYTDSAFRQHVDTSALQPAPTSFITKELRERINDGAFIAALLDATNNTKLLFTFEAKSRPTVFAPIQLLGYAGISMLADFADAGYPETFGEFNPKASIMVLLYYGKKDIDEDLYFQSVYKNLPDWLKEFVPQFRIIVINLRKYLGGTFPGSPVVRAWAESLVWTAEGKLTNHLDSVFANFRDEPVDALVQEMITDIFEVCCKKEDISAEEMDSAISKFFTDKETAEMLQTVKRGFYQEAEARGDARGAARERLEARQRMVSVILKSICKNCHVAQVPDDIVEELNNRQDIFGLESLFEDSLECTSLEEFRQKL